MKTRFFGTVAAAWILSTAATASAAVHSFQVDPGHSSVAFTVRHLVSKVPGRFGEFDGTVTMDPTAIESTLKVTGKIKAASIDTGVDKRDNHLRSADFLEVEKYPEITFTSKKAVKSGDKYAVTGDLTIHGVTKEVVFDTAVLGVTKSDHPTVGIEMNGKINRKDFGVLWNRTLDDGGFVLGDDVDISILIEANVPKPEPATKS
jgi:polyisoprenoid-binding protein YceI